MNPSSLFMALLATLTQCGDADTNEPRGTYQASCDRGAYVEFLDSSRVKVFFNMCEGYFDDIGTYSRSGDVITIRHLDQGRTAEERFRVIDARTLEQLPAPDDVTCGNCQPGARYTRR